MKGSKQVLFIGGGVVGAAVRRCLIENDYEVSCISRTKPTWLLKATFLQADLLQVDVRSIAESILNADFIICCAWCTEPGAYWESEENAQWVSFYRRVIDFVRIHGSVGRQRVMHFFGTYEEVKPVRVDTRYVTAKSLLRQYILNTTDSMTNTYFSWWILPTILSPYQQSGRFFDRIVTAASENAPSDFDGDQRKIPVVIDSHLGRRVASNLRHSSPGIQINICIQVWVKIEDLFKFLRSQVSGTSEISGSTLTYDDEESDGRFQRDLVDILRTYLKGEK
jgi:nucleoside-diphosphate-sugar epimerase